MSVVLSPFVGTRDGSQGFEHSRRAHFHCAVSLALNWHFQEVVFMLNLSPNCIIVTSGRPPLPRTDQLELVGKSRINWPVFKRDREAWQGESGLRSSLNKHPVGINFWSRDWFLRTGSGCPATSSSRWTQALLSPLRAFLQRRTQTSVFTPGCSSWAPLPSLQYPVLFCFCRVITSSLLVSGHSGFMCAEVW